MSRIPPLVALLAASALASPGRAQTPLAAELLVDGLDRPLWVGSPAGDGRVFVCEQYLGRIRVIAGGALLPTPFLDLSGSITPAPEQGLLGMAFHPDFGSNGRVFVAYSDLAGSTALAEYTLSSTDPNLLDPSSARVILTVPQPSPHHNGGGVAFGPLDGYLYMGLGDGTWNPNCSGQSPADLLGKFVRIDVDGATPYAIPPDNPFATGGPFLPEVWSTGHRNPWRFAFDAQTGELFVADVGASSWEEVNHEPALTGGRNYGWPVYEGGKCSVPQSCAGLAAPCGDPSYTSALHEYDHTTGCAVVGGVVYRGAALPALQGKYFFADHCAARVWSIRAAGGVASELVDHTSDLDPGFGLSIATPSSFGVDGAGEILIVDYFGGEVFRVVPAPVDCDGNGVPDSQDIAADPSLDLDGSGTIDLCEGFAADSGQVSVASGGTIAFTLAASTAHAGKVYLLLGSAAGTAPGILVNGLLFSLNINDAYFAYTLANANGAVMQQSLGSLDGVGLAAAQLALPPLPANLVGLQLNHAYLAFDIPGAGAVKFTSKPLPLDLVP